VGRGLDWLDENKLADLDLDFALFEETWSGMQQLAKTVLE